MQQFSVLQVVVQKINETLREDSNVSRATINEVIILWGVVVSSFPVVISACN